MGEGDRGQGGDWRREREEEKGKNKKGGERKTESEKRELHIHGTVPWELRRIKPDSLASQQENSK